jgi:hypothetical protein
MAPDGCPTERAVHDEALRLLAGPPISPERRVAAVARVTRSESGRWRVEVSMSSAVARGQRSLEADSCAGLADATALIVAIMVDPDRAGAVAAAPAPTALPTEVTPAPSSPPPQRDRPAPLAVFAPRPRWTASLLGLADLGTLPAPALGGVLGLAAVVGRFRADIAWGLLPSRTYTVSSASGVGADMSLWTASASFAYVAPLGRTELALGGGAEATHVSAVGVSSDTPFVGIAGSAAWPALRADATFTAPIFAPVFVRLDAAGVAPLARPAFVIDPLGVVHRPSVLTARLAAGVEVRF